MPLHFSSRLEFIQQILKQFCIHIRSYIIDSPNNPNTSTNDNALNPQLLHSYHQNPVSPPPPPASHYYLNNKK